jgi:hypothetical protein
MGYEMRLMQPLKTGCTKLSLKCNGVGIDKKRVIIKHRNAYKSFKKLPSQQVRYETL